MKPKNLKCPFSWDDRRPMVCDRVLYVPEYYDRHQEFAFPGWEDPALFGKPGKIVIEFCAGNGSWILEKALQNPNVHWVAVDLRFDRARKIWSKIKNYQLENLIVVCGEALTFVQHYLKDSTIAASYVNFPDPWPKEKHAKNRLLRTQFFTELTRVHICGGELMIVTDDPMYKQQILQEAAACGQWRPSLPEPYFVTDWPDYGGSYFDQLWREKGRTIHYMQFINQKMAHV